MEGWNTTVISFWGPACFQGAYIMASQPTTQRTPPEIRPNQGF